MACYSGNDIEPNGYLVSFDSVTAEPVQMKSILAEDE